MTWLGTACLALLAGSGFVLATSALAALAWPLAEKRLRRRHPALRARAALLAAVAPAPLAAALVMLCLLLGLLGLLGLPTDHCRQHAEHPHLCLVHPAAALAPRVALPLVAGAALLAAGLACGAARLARGRRSLAGLRLGATRTLASGESLLDSAQPFSFAAGLRRPEIFVSTGLARRLAPEQLRVVLAHERAHARRRDGLRMLLARVASLPHLPWVRRRLLAELALATERACDEEAAREAGDRLAVAETLLAVERLAADAPWRGCEAAPAFGGSAVPARVEGLLAELPAAGSPPALVRTAAVALAAAALLAAPLHHWTEHALALLLRLF
jgi:hypothetical protein